MGNSDSRHPDIIMQHQKLEEWMKVEDQGFCELWLHKKTGRQLQAYPITHFVAGDRQQQEKYAFRKAHGSHLVAIEGILGESDGFLCSQPRTSYVLVENIVSRLGQHHRSFSFEQALYILSSAATGYNTLNSFFGPLEPNEDMICINEQGSIKVWLNENLSKNEPSSSARSLEDERGNIQSPAEDYTIAKRRIKQCVSKLFKIVEAATVQGFPLQFREESRNVSTYFEAVNFVEHYSQQNNIKMAENLPTTSIKVFKKSQVIQTVPSQTTIVQNIQFASQQAIREPVGNLDSSRVQNIVFKSNYVREVGFASPGLKGSHAIVERVPVTLERSKTEINFIPAPLFQSPQQPRISFQVRPSVTYMASPIRTAQRYNTTILPSPSQPHILHFPPQRVVYSPIVNAVNVPSPQQKAVHQEILPKPIEPQIEPKQSVVQIQHNIQIVESELKHPEKSNPVEIKNTLIDKIKHERENSNVQFTEQAFSDEKSEGIKEEANAIEEQQNINQTNFTFQSQQMRQQLLQRAREEAALEQDIKRRQGEHVEQQPEQQFNEALRLRNTDGYVQSEEDDVQHEYEHYEEYFQNRQDQQEMNQKEEVIEVHEESRHGQNSHGYTDSQYSQIDQYVPPPEYREYREYREERSPIPEQEESFPPSPRKQKNNTEIEEWEAQLNKFTLSSKKTEKLESSLQNQIHQCEGQYRDPQSNRQIYAGTSKEQYVNQMANLDHDDIEKYIRMKYQLYLGEDTQNNSEHPNVSFPIGFKKVESYDYQNSYKNKLSSYKEKDAFPAYEYVDYENKPIIGKENYEPYKNNYQYEGNDEYISTNRVSIENNFQGNSTGRSSVQAGFPNLHNHTSYENKFDQYKQEYMPRKDSQKNRFRVAQTSKIDEKYSKYVLNSQKIKPPVSRGTNSRDISLIIPVDESKILYMSPRPTYQRETTKKSTYQASEPNNNKKGITYEKLRNLLWEQ